MEPLLSLKHVSKTFPVGKTLLGKPDKFVHAVNDVSFDVYKGETFSIVGESGCGKSTTGRLINHLLTPDSGEIKFIGQEISHLTQDQMRPLRKDVQMIFQDPAGSLNPRMRVEDLIAEPLLIHTDMSKAERMEVVHELLGIVGLSPKHAKRYPHEFSGGQKQRIGIARALTVKPKLIIADEPISALDVSIQAQVLNLLHHLQEKFDLTYVFISHDLSVRGNDLRPDRRYVPRLRCGDCSQGNALSGSDASLHPGSSLRRSDSGSRPQERADHPGGRYPQHHQSPQRLSLRCQM